MGTSVGHIKDSEPKEDVWRPSGAGAVVTAGSVDRERTCQTPLSLATYLT